MQRVARFADRLFGSLPGLLALAVAWDALLVASLAPFSGPLRPLGLASLLAGSAGRGPRARLRALMRDPVRFGIFAELMLVNVVVTAPGVYVALNLETYRSPAYLAVERTILVGHWHILATLSAVMVLLLVVDRLGREPGARWLNHRLLRPLAGWGLLLGSTLSFVFVNAYMFRQPGQERAWAVPFFEVGISLSLLALALLAAGLLADRLAADPGKM